MMIRFRKVNLDNFFESLETMIEAGLSVTEALETLSTSRNKALANLSKKLVKDIKAGKTLSSSLRSYLSLEEYSILASQERSGNIAEGIKRYKKLKNIKGKAKSSFISAFAYPLFILIFLIGIIYVLGEKVSKELVGIVGEAKFQQSPLYFYYQMSRPMNIGLLVLFVGGVIGALLGFIFKAMGDYRIKTDRIMPFSLYRYFQGIAFLFMLSSLMRSGYNMVQAIDEIIKISAYMKVMLKPIKKRIQASDNIGEAMIRTRIYLPDEKTAELLAVISKYSGIEEKLEQIAEKKIEGLLKQIGVVGKVLQMITLILAGLVIAGFVLGMQQTLADLSQSIR